MQNSMTRREDYLKLIYTLSQRGQVRSADVADALELTRPTVCVYLKRLVRIGDITMDSHRLIHLTEQGTAIAEVTLDKHGTLCALLRDLGVPDSIAVSDACAIEHNLSPETYLALKQLLQERQVRV